MPVHMIRATAAAAALAALGALLPADAMAGHRDNPDGYGIYSPLDPKGEAYRYDPRSWYYGQPRRPHYPDYGSPYWVPRAQMRYRYRYLYYGPKYRYHPAWGYPRDEDNPGPHHWRW